MAELPIPGTITQVDLFHNLGDVQHVRDIVLTPQPSANPDDPLNWGKFRKRLNLSLQMAWTFVGAAQVSSLSPANLLVQADTGIPVANINTGTGLMYLFFGWSNLVWQPLALNYGRRPVLLLALLGTSFMLIWSAHCNSTSEWYINRVLMGIFMAPIETLIEVTISDVVFSHERGYWMGWYVWTLFDGSYLGPLAAGFVADRYGWRWIQYICAIIGFALFLIMLFTFEDTMFFRPHAQSAVEGNPEAAVEADKSESKGPEGKVLIVSQDNVSGDSTYQPRTFAQKLKVWGLRDHDQPKKFFAGFYLSFAMVQFPVVLYSGLLVGSILSWFNVVNGTMATILGNLPYNFSANMIGVTYLAPIIGVTFGSYFSGWMSDILADRLARRNKGVKEPEHRLWVSIIPLILHPTGCILYGVGAAHGIHWIGIAFGLAMLAAPLPMGSSVAFNYIIDSYEELSGHGLVTSILIRNTMGMQCPQTLTCIRY
jgi:MFS family permease